jgi:hypothetical protein
MTLHTATPDYRLTSSVILHARTRWPQLAATTASPMLAAPRFASQPAG